MRKVILQSAALKQLCQVDTDLAGLEEIYATALGLYMAVLIAKAHQKYPATTDASKKQLRTAIVDCNKLLIGPPTMTKENCLPQELLERIDSVASFKF